MTSRKAVVASEDTSVHKLADLIITRRLNRVPIVRDGELVGIAARADRVRALAQEADDGAGPPL